MIRKYIYLVAVALCLFSCTSGTKGTELKVLQLNMWHGTTTVPNGFKGLTSIILQTDADVVLLCEMQNNKENPLIKRLTDTLNTENKVYYGAHLGHSTAILSKYPLKNETMPFKLENNSSPITKAMIEVNGKNIVCYSAHLDYTHYECYMPRGYSGTTWKQLDAPVTDAEFILESNRISYRDEAIRAFITDAAKEREQGNLVLLGGDFNEPSHLDWQADTKDLWDHNGVVINWDCSVLLQNAGYKDTFREKYASAVTHPGFTFPSANPAVPVSKLAWAPKADERDRIDFIYYYPDSNISLESISLVGPSQTILRGVQSENETKDNFIEPASVWPTDHKGNLAVFKVF
ncbi:endonuclease/exonuclease/phosphatase family protein [Bacteroides sp. 519]|uniref:endonuclease/exonuclease/phosphatase family protein n=1 Tax=Bacteroides sp. 519 TaxID=2302937 RepID=UPI0013D6C385|nr:endonuclease/exonuclease/phosphatase family protein [Bacteroides sp. 519]NDV57523.1 endonuclease/exonuclease/phosphatase family protein [Bacteroides sp. 519]